MTPKSDYIRVCDKIHKPPCRYSSSTYAVPWNFADGMKEDGVRAVVARTSWLSLCKVCWEADGE